MTNEAGQPGKTKVVRHGARNPVSAREATPVRDMRQAQPPDADTMGQRRLVRQVGKPAEREYAPQKFDGRRNTDEESARSRILEVADGETGRPDIVAADTPAPGGGGPIIVESDSVLGGGVAAPARPQRRQAARTGASWQSGTPGTQQDMVLEAPVGDGRDPEALPAEQQTRKAGPSAYGPAIPTGNPCTCAFQWEEIEQEDGSKVVNLYTTGGLATGFKGAPRFMTWCIVCGGERDGEFRPENAIKYGDYVPPAPQPLNATRVQEQVVETVMDQVGSMIASDRFIDALAERVAAKVAAKA